MLKVIWKQNIYLVLLILFVFGATGYLATSEASESSKFSWVSTKSLGYNERSAVVTSAYNMTGEYGINVVCRNPTRPEYSSNIRVKKLGNLVACEDEVDGSGTKNIASGYVSINHRIGMTTGGNENRVGSSINFSYNPDDPFFLNSGNGNWDTPYGEGTGDGSDFIPIARENVEKKGQFIYGFENRPGYVYWSAIKPSVKMVSSNPAVIRCDGMNCTAVGAGNARVVAQIDKTRAHMWAMAYGYNKNFMGIDFTSGVYFPGKVKEVSPAEVPINLLIGKSPFHRSNSFIDEKYIADNYIIYAGTTLVNDGIIDIDSASVYWDIKVIDTINGSCGTKNRSYAFSESIAKWNADSWCAQGVVNFPNGAPTFPATGGISGIWSCMGSGTDHANALNCQSSRQSAPPSIPSISGPDKCDKNAICEGFKIVTASTDPEGNNVIYKIDWDNVGFAQEDFGASVPSGTAPVPNLKSHLWDTSALQKIKVQACDKSGACSDWSSPLVVGVIECAINTFPNAIACSSDRTGLPAYVLGAPSMLVGSKVKEVLKSDCSKDVNIKCKAVCSAGYIVDVSGINCKMCTPSNNCERNTCIGNVCNNGCAEIIGIKDCRDGSWQEESPE